MHYIILLQILRPEFAVIRTVARYGVVENRSILRFLYVRVIQRIWNWNQVFPDKIHYQGQYYLHHVLSSQGHWDLFQYVFFLPLFLRVIRQKCWMRFILWNNLYSCNHSHCAEMNTLLMPLSMFVHNMFFILLKNHLQAMTWRQLPFTMLSIEKSSWRH